MTHDSPTYGLWFLVVLSSAVFIIFAFRFFKPNTARDWRTLGDDSALVAALFAEMYGFALTLYLLSGWLQTKYPNLDVLSHNAGHLWSTLLGEKGDPHFNILLQWATLRTLLMFPVLLFMYGRLAVTEETEMRAEFGDAFERYVQRTPRFFPRLGRSPTVV